MNHFQTLLQFSPKTEDLAVWLNDPILYAFIGYQHYQNRGRKFMNYLKQGLALALASNLFAQAAFADGLLQPKVLPKEAQAVTTIQAEAVQIQTSVPNSVSEAVKIADKDFDKYITVEKLSQPMESKLTEMYSGYKVVLNSDYPRTLTLKSASVTNAVAGNVAAKVVRDNPWKGLLWLFVPYLGIILCPTMTIAYNVGNSKAKKEAIRYPGQVPAGSLKRGEPIQFFTMVPAGQTPSLSLKFNDKETDQDFILSSI